MPWYAWCVFAPPRAPGITSRTIWDYLGLSGQTFVPCVCVFALFVPCLQRDLCWISSYYAVQKCPKALQVRALQVHLVIWVPIQHQGLTFSCKSCIQHVNLLQSLATCCITVTALPSVDSDSGHSSRASRLASQHPSIPASNSLFAFPEFLRSQLLKFHFEAANQGRNSFGPWSSFLVQQLVKGIINLVILSISIYIYIHKYVCVWYCPILSRISWITVSCTRWRL